MLIDYVKLDKLLRAEIAARPSDRHQPGLDQPFPGPRLSSVTALKSESPGP